MVLIAMMFLNLIAQLLPQGAVSQLLKQASLRVQVSVG